VSNPPLSKHKLRSRSKYKRLHKQIQIQTLKICYKNTSGSISKQTQIWKYKCQTLSQNGSQGKGSTRGLTHRAATTKKGGTCSLTHTMAATKKGHGTHTQPRDSPRLLQDSSCSIVHGNKGRLEEVHHIITKQAEST
jgi:hypothetical protein